MKEDAGATGQAGGRRRGGLRRSASVAAAFRHALFPTSASSTTSTFSASSDTAASSAYSTSSTTPSNTSDFPRSRPRSGSGLPVLDLSGRLSPLPVLESPPRRYLGHSCGADPRMSSKADACHPRAPHDAVDTTPTAWTFKTNIAHPLTTQDTADVSPSVWMSAKKDACHPRAPHGAWAPEGDTWYPRPSQDTQETSSCPPRSLKMVLVGDQRAGKSSLLRRLREDSFDEGYRPTGFDTYRTLLEAGGGAQLDVTVWDTAGCPGYDGVRPLAYSDCQMFLLCFDLADGDSVRRLRDKWVDEIRGTCPAARILLVGCKSDAAADSAAANERSGSLSDVSSASSLAASKLSFDEGARLAEAVGSCMYCESSAKMDAASVRDVFHLAAFAASGKAGKQCSLRRRKSLLRRPKMAAPTGRPACRLM